MLRGAVLLWETHLLGLETRKDQLELRLDELRASQQQRMQVFFILVFFVDFFVVNCLH